MIEAFAAMRLSIPYPFVWLVLAASASAQTLPPASSAKVDFTRDIRPIFRKNCLGCHGAQQQMSGLRLDNRADALKGGYSGAVLMAGSSEASKLIQIVAGLKKPLIMPPAGAPLGAEQIGLLRAWIDQGLDWPEAPVSQASATQSSHWAFQPPQRPKPPAVGTARWVRNPIDAFVLARLEKEGIAPSPEADKPTLLRRLSLDLTGLPPAPEELAAFLADTRPDAYERQVTRLLDSPHYGEKWARQWLDLARYADSDGYEKDLQRPYAWRWRNWVIQALNRDMPFDQFTIEQIAGDLLPNPTVEQKVATGFHRNTLTNREGGIDREQLRVEQAVDRTSTTGAVWLGLTVGCAQCHDHKYDPISQKEFYQLLAYYNPLDEVDIEAPLPGEVGPYLRALPEYRRKRDELLKQYGVEPLQTEWEPKVREAGNQQGKFGGDWDLAWTVLWNDERQILFKNPVERTQKEQDKLTDHFLEWYSAVVTKERYAELKFKELREKLRKLAAGFPALTEAQTLADMPNPPRAHVLLRGDFRNPGIEVQPGVPSVLDRSKAARPTRLELAKWLVARDNPLTARVTVNRTWQSFFGRGLVLTPADFGTKGDPPSHPELLDWLAVEFMDRGWSLKGIDRLIVTSATYRQASHARKELDSRDPSNRLLARQNRLRLEAELLRDSALAVSGLLEPSIGGSSVRPPQPPELTKLGYGDFVKWPESEGKDRYRRGLYIFFQRTVPYPQLMTFDGPDSNVACTRRDRSNTPLQALNLLNDPVFVEAAQALAVRLLRDQPASDINRIEYAFRLCLGREPSPQEKDRVATFLRQQKDRLQAEPKVAAALYAGRIEEAKPAELAAWISLSRSLLNVDEFLTRE